MILPGFVEGTRLEYVASRAYTSRFASMTPEELIGHLEPGSLGPRALTKQIVYRGAEVLDEVALDLLRDPSQRLMEGIDISVAAAYEDLTEHLYSFVLTSAGDAVAATMTISRIPQGRALAIALSDQSKEAVRKYAYHKGNDTLPMPDEETLINGEFIGDTRLRYSPALGHLATTYPGTEEGCPVARGGGHLIKKFYALVASVTIAQVECPQGEKYFTKDDVAA